MGELGYQEGRNFSFDFLQTASADEYEVLYRKLAARVPDVILAIGPEIGLKSALAVTRARLAGLPSSRHTLLHSLGVPDLRTGDDSPLRTSLRPETQKTCHSR
jgi:hypothetical protein